MVKKAKKPEFPVHAGKPAGALIGNKKLKQLYAAMFQRRILEERRALLHPRRRSDSCMAGAGREAAEVGCTVDLRAGDAIASSRYGSLEHHWIASFLPDASHCLQPEIGQFNLGQAGICRAATRRLDPGALAAGAKRIERSKNVILAFSGGCASSLPGWRETLRLAGAQALPIIFVQWGQLPAGPTAVEPSTKMQNGKLEAGELETKKLKTGDYGFPTIPVDGHDVIAVYRVAHEAIRRARQGGGPTLIACQAYVPDVTTARRPNRSRPAAGKSEWMMDTDPIRRMERYLAGKGLLRGSWKHRILREFSRTLEAAERGAPGWSRHRKSALAFD